MNGTAGAAVTAAGSTIQDGVAGSGAGSAKAGSTKLPTVLSTVMVMIDCIADESGWRLNLIWY